LRILARTRPILEDYDSSVRDREGLKERVKTKRYEKRYEQQMMGNYV
jgi:hypothetical protein